MILIILLSNLTCWMSTYPVNSTWVGVPLVTMRPFEITSWRFQRLKIQKVIICPAKIHRLGRTCAAFPQCASSTLPLLSCLSFSSLLLTLQQPARCKNFFDQETLSGCNTTIRARSFSMGPQRSSCEWGNVGDQSLQGKAPPNLQNPCSCWSIYWAKGILGLDDIDPKLGWKTS